MILLTDKEEMDMLVGQIHLAKRNEWVDVREFNNKQQAKEWVELLTTGFYPLNKTDVRIVTR